MKSTTWAAGIASVCVAIMIGCAGSGDNSSQLYTESVLRMVKLSAGVQGYVGDNDDNFPPSDWMALTTPYVPDPKDYVSPRFDGVSGKYGYALSDITIGKNISQLDPSAPLLFDSTNTGYNAIASPDTMPSPPRYGDKNTIALVDGTVIDEVIPPKTNYEISIERVKRMSLSQIMYTNDYEDVFSVATRWMDEVTPYVTDETFFHSPIYDGTSNYGYAMHSELSERSASSLDSPATFFMLFDSTLLERNASGSPETRPVPGRYEGKNTWSFADGHVTGG